DAAPPHLGLTVRTGQDPVVHRLPLVDVGGLVFVIASAVWRTMPSVGISAVGSVHFRNVAGSSAATLRDQSIARLCVPTRLVSSTIGSGSPLANSADSMAVQSLPSVTRCMTVALADQ